MSNDPHDNESTFRRILTAVKDSHPVPDPVEELFFDPESGKLTVSRGAPTTRRSAVAAGTLAREGFFGTMDV